MSTVKLNNGESANNVEVKDMSPKKAGMSIEEFAVLQKQFDELINSNEIKLSARIRNKEVKIGGEIKNKATGALEIDDNGEVRRYPTNYYVSLLFQGGSLDYKCSESMYSELDLNSTYLFKGYLGVVKEYGRETISPIFQSYSKVL